MSATAPASPRPDRLSGDTGSVVAEFALLLPFLVVMVLGILEFGTAFRERANLEQALQSVGPHRGQPGRALGRPTTWRCSRSTALVSQSRNLTVNKVVIYKTIDSANGSPQQSTCFTNATPSAAYNCSVYTGAQVTRSGRIRAAPSSPPTSAPAAPTCSTSARGTTNWCPLDRNVKQGDPPDYVGVYANVTYKSTDRSCCPAP